VPFALAGISELASLFVDFARRIVDPTAVESAAAPAKRTSLDLRRLASMW
jgi:hypothetical protein